MWPESNKTQELLAAIEGGSDDAVNQLLERHRDAVRRMVQMRLDQKIQRRVDVSDVVQEVCVEASRRLQKYLADPRLPFHLWIRQIAKDRIIDAHRRHRGSAKRSVDREQRMSTPEGMDHSTMDLAAQLCDAELTPAAAAMQREIGQRVEEAIEELPEQDYEIVVMRHFEKLSNQAIAQSLGLSEQATSMRHLRAMRRLREILAPPSTDNED